MPSTYAHYRFGAEALPKLSPEIRTVAERFRTLFDVGLHGPDFFFYYSPLRHTKTGGLGSVYHRMSGDEFFRSCARKLRLEPSEAGWAYLLGVLGHFCLDSVCHPYVRQWNDTGRAGHVEIETEFDRYLLELDGKCPAHTQDLSGHMRLGPGGCETVAGFYPQAAPSGVRRGLGHMAFATKALAAPEGLRRRIVEKAVGLAGKETGQLLMGPATNPRCAWAGPELLPLYRKALEKFPSMAQALANHIARGTPLPQDFAPCFG